MSYDQIMSKWKFIANQLKKLEAPDEVVNAAIEIENILISLHLNYNTSHWTHNYSRIIGSGSLSAGSLLEIIKSCDFCSASADCNNHCYQCRLGTKGGCTPIYKYPHNYFKIVTNWIYNKFKYNV